MLKNFKKIDTKHTGLFAAGVLFGTAGIKILASEDSAISLPCSMPKLT